MEDNSSVIISFGATHYTECLNTWLDPCLVYALDDVNDYGKTDTSFIAGHDLITPSNHGPILKSPTRTVTYRDFK